mgnify:FL=1
MQSKNNTKQRNASIQGLRSLKDTLPTNIKKVINKRGQIYSEILNNWKYIAGEKLFKVCYPKSYKNSNKFNVSTLIIMVKRGHEIDLEYSKKEIINKVNSLFENIIVERIKFTCFNDEKETISYKSKVDVNVTNNKYQKKIDDVNNEKIKKSLFELTKVFRKK